MKLELYNELRKEVSEHPLVVDVQLDEDFVVPGLQQAGFAPYDAVVFFDVEEGYTGDEHPLEFEDWLENSDVTYEELINVGEHETSDPGNYSAYISLVNR